MTATMVQPGRLVDFDALCPYEIGAPGLINEGKAPISYGIGFNLESSGNEIYYT